MNPESLIAHFDRISDATDAIPRLRQFILDLAVRGKLVEQNPKDEPATEFLRRIQVEKTRLVTAAAIKKSTNDKSNGEIRISPLKTNGTQFVIPSNWVWVSFGKIMISRDGERIPVSQDERNSRAKTYDYYGASGVIDKIDGYLFEKPLLLIGEDGANLVNRSTPIAFIARGKYWVNNHAHVLDGISEEFLKFIELYINAIDLKPFVTGTAQPKMNQAKMNSIPVALPPEAEQIRIVAKVGELMALCDRLEQLRVEQEIRRARLTAASHHHLNNGGDIDAVRKHARFLIGHIPHLTTRPDQIKQLRQTILNLAVRGQLVPQDPKDEPASELLRRISTEKAQLAKKGLIKKIDSMALPMSSEFPFPIPSGWTTSRLQALCTSVTDGDHLPPPKADKGIPFLVIGNVRSQTVNFAGCRHVSEQYYDALDAIRRPQKRDILYTLVGSYGIPVMITDNIHFCVQRHIGILRPSSVINVRFLYRILESKWVFEQATACATGIAQKTVPLAGLRKILIPLPPLAEQQRIVARVDELMALCDQLEAQLTSAQTDTSRLLEAVLSHAPVVSF